MYRRKGIDQQEIKKIASELGLSISVVENVVCSQFDFIRYVVQRGDFETVRLPYIGKFNVSKFLLKKVNTKDGTLPVGKRTRGTRQSRGVDGPGIQSSNTQGSAS